MADELKLNATVQLDDGISDIAVQIVDLMVTLGTVKFTSLIQSIGITEEAIQLGEVTSPGYAIFINLDPTNWVDLKVATGGAICSRLDPDTDSNGKGGLHLSKLGSGMQAPFAIAGTAPCRIRILICSV